MPHVESHYSPNPYYLNNRHLETILPSVFNKVNGVAYRRERLELEDGDFLDLDWLNNQNKRIMILSHGMEGSSHRAYVKRFAKYFYDKGWDILAWNYRSCSGEMNRLPKFYDYGNTYDFSTVVDHALSKPYRQIVLVGFSMGGGLTIKYLGTHKINDRISHGIAFSVSCDLKDSATEVEKPKHIIYNKSFINKLKTKLRRKAEQFDEFKKIPIGSIKSFNEFNRNYSLPFHNFKTLDEFYQASSSGPHIQKIRVPTLMVNALNDPILGTKCYPFKAAEDNPNFFLETPKQGGHLGFMLKGNPFSYMELRAEEFILSN